MASKTSRLNRNQRRAEIQKAALDNLVPMLIESYQDDQSELLAYLQQEKAEDIKTIYKHILFARVPVKCLKNLSKLAKVRNLEPTPQLLTKHEILMARTLILESVLAQCIKVRKGQTLGDDLREILQDSERTRQELKNGVGTAHWKFSEDQRDIWDDTAETLGKKILLEKMIEAVKNQITSLQAGNRFESKFQTAQLDRLLENLEDSVKSLNPAPGENDEKA